MAAFPCAPRLRVDSPLAPDAVWLLELPRGNRSYLGLERWYRRVPIPVLYPIRTRNDDYNFIEEIQNQSADELMRLADTPLQTVPYCDWHGYSPTEVIRINACETHVREDLPIIPALKSCGEMERRQIEVLRHIVNSNLKDQALPKWQNVPTRIPPSMLQALIDFIFTGAIVRFRRQQAAKAQPRPPTIDIMDISRIKSEMAQAQPARMGGGQWDTLRELLASCSASSVPSSSAAAPPLAASSSWCVLSNLCAVPAEFGVDGTDVFADVMEAWTEFSEQLEAEHGKPTVDALRPMEQSIISIFNPKTKIKREAIAAAAANGGAKSALCTSLITAPPVRWMLPMDGGLAPTGPPLPHRLARCIMEKIGLELVLLTVVTVDGGAPEIRRVVWGENAPIPVLPPMANADAPMPGAAAASEGDQPTAMDIDVMGDRRVKVETEEEEQKASGAPMAQAQAAAAANDPAAAAAPTASPSLRRVCVVLSPNSASGAEHFLCCRDPTLQHRLEQLADSAPPLSLPLPPKHVAADLNVAAEDDQPGDDIDSEGRNKTANKRKHFHCALFQLSPRKDAQSLLTTLLVESFFLLGCLLRPWLESKLGESRAVWEAAGAEVEPTTKERVRLMYRGTYARIQCSPNSKTSQQDAEKLDRMEEKLEEWKGELYMKHAGEDTSQAETIRKLLAYQWSRLELRMQRQQQGEADPQIVPSLRDLVPGLCYLSNRGCVRRGNNQVSASLDQTRLAESRLRVMDYDLSECNSQSIPENMILVGSNAHSRGITLSGLRVTYYGRATKNETVDTTIQMGRWLGHRLPLERDICTVFMHERSARTFMALALHHHLLRRSVKQFILSGQDIRRDPLILHSFSTMQLTTLHDTMVRLRPIALQMTRPVLTESVHNWRATEELLASLRASAVPNVNCLGASQGAHVFYRVPPALVMAYLSSLRCADYAPKLMREDMNRKIEELQHQGSADQRADLLHVVVLSPEEAPWRDEEGWPRMPLRRSVDPARNTFNNAALFDATCELQTDQASSLVVSGVPAVSVVVPCITGESRRWFEFESRPALSNDPDIAEDDFSLPTQLEARKPGAPYLLIVRRIKPTPTTHFDAWRAALADANASASSSALPLKASTLYMPGLCYIRGESFMEAVAAGYSADNTLNTVGLAASGHVPKPFQPIKKPSRGKKQLAKEAHLAQLTLHRRMLNLSTLRDLTRADLLQDRGLNADFPISPDVRLSGWVARRRWVKAETNLNINKNVRSMLCEVLQELTLLPALWVADENVNYFYEPMMEFEETQETGEARGAAATAAASSCGPMADLNDTGLSSTFPEVVSRIDGEDLSNFESCLDSHSSFGVSLYLMRRWLESDQYATLSQFEEDLLVMAFNAVHFVSLEQSKKRADAIIKRWREQLPLLLQQSEATKETAEKAAADKAAAKLARAAKKKQKKLEAATRAAAGESADDDDDNLGDASSAASATPRAASRSKRSSQGGSASTPRSRQAASHSRQRRGSDASVASDAAGSENDFSPHARNSSREAGAARSLLAQLSSPSLGQPPTVPELQSDPEDEDWRPSPGEE